MKQPPAGQLGLSLLGEPEEPQPCPQEAEHEHGPEDVNEWIAWAEARMAHGDVQRSCPGCGRPLRWVASGPAVELPSADSGHGSRRAG